MNFNELSSIGLTLVQDQLNSRAKLDTGTHCNYDCSFCYYTDQLDVVTDLAKIKQRAKKLRHFGMAEIDLSGGESSIHKNWFEILDYCRELGFSSVSALTNASKFADMNFLKKSQDRGLSELLISLHGWNSEGHDLIVKRKGSFNKILKTIENASEIGIKIRLNCTVTSLNAPHLLVYADLVNSIHPVQVNFLPLNYWGDAKNAEAENYEYLSAAIKGAIDLIDKKIEINVRYIPFCFMVGYEKYVVGIYQHIFDLGDWNIIAYDVDNLNVASAPVTLQDYFDEARKKRINSYYKSIKCFKCQYFNICDGVEHKLSSKQEIYPLAGEKIVDVMHFKRLEISSCH